MTRPDTEYANNKLAELEINTLSDIGLTESQEQLVGYWTEYWKGVFYDYGMEAGRELLQTELKSLLGIND